MRAVRGCTIPIFVVLATIESCTLLPLAQAFASPSTGQSTTATAAVPPELLEQALTVYNTKFPFDTFSGTDDDSGTTKRKAVFGSISRTAAIDSFTELAQAYGADDALNMVQSVPICLAFNKDNFAPSLAAYSELFGSDEAKAMVRRNPGLLAVTPTNAAASEMSTMVLSYIVGYTRPVSLVLLPLFFACLSVPVIEGVTGLDIHTKFFGFLYQ